MKSSRAMGPYLTDLQVRWQPAIGDPTLLGWLTTLGYAVAAILSARKAVHLCGQAQHRDRGHARVWWAVAVFLFLLAVNKELDLQSALTALGRAIARKHGWYPYRRTVQAWFIAGFSGLVAAFLLAVSYRLGRFWQKERVLLIAISLIAFFIIVRAASFHHVDRLLRIHLLGAKLAAVIELAAVGLFLLAALKDNRDNADL
ncbi:MAG: hypothetical protein N2255_03325 [Kiritimatiellae bacterium]|nr:hypothetical protein [Kiritimatiellia bacterium]